ncbi:MAG TPA: histidine--tRNA ligase [Fimbriiglobus sp.]|nr:histidine--tRNA ligase [Fimbriiglobus sp.]
MSKLIEPRTLKGFRDYPPKLMIPRERVLETARRVYRSYGYAPIDTPALEYAEVLLGKGGEESDRLVYRFKDHGDRDVAMRFDLTVPFARFAAENVPQLGTPFRRYAMGPVWRGENTSAGRYREFWQCDFDTIGTTANAADIEVALVICDLFAALEINRFEVRVNNRMVLNGLLESLGLAGMATPLLRSLDKLPKIGRDKVIEEMVREAGVTTEQAGRVLILAETTGSNAEVLDRVEREFGANERAAEGVRRLRELVAVCAAAGVLDGRVKIDLSIARGLDYYTGTIYETFLLDLPGIGSVCSGGRYDNLASLYTKQVLPGVGASLGVDRLLAAMEELKHPWMSGVSTPAPVLVLQFDAARLGDYQRIARELRAAGVATEVYPEAKKLKAQFEYADRRGFRLALIAGPEEFDKGVWKIKDLAKREETAVPAGDLVAAVGRILG